MNVLIFRVGYKKKRALLQRDAGDQYVLHVYLGFALRLNELPAIIQPNSSLPADDAVPRNRFIKEGA